MKKKIINWFCRCRSGWVHITDLMAMADDEGIDLGVLLSMYENYIDNQRVSIFNFKNIYLIAAYLVAIVAANLLVTQFGPSIAIINAFLFIGLDLTTRDYLHEAWRGKRLWSKMLILIAAGSILSFALNRNAGPIALASFVAFAGAGIADTFIYWLLGDKGRLLKINGSNVVSAAVDSLIFPVLAFGFPVLWSIVGGQFLAKVGGGFIWSVILGFWKR